MRDRIVFKQKVAENGQSIEFQQHDVRNLPFENKFDVAIMLCKGGFTLMETDEMNFDILKHVTDCIKKSREINFHYTERASSAV